MADVKKVAPAEAEEAVSGGAIPIETELRGGEERHTELGETSAGRLLIVVWTWRHLKVRVVTAFPPSRKWRGLWQRLRKGAGSNA